LIALSARELCRADYTQAQVEAAIGTAWGVDTQLIRDRTYFVVSASAAPDEFLACGGWSKRRTLFGGDQHATREPELLDPQLEAARIRAFFVQPQAARRGIGRTLLAHCEHAAYAAGYRSAELVATLPGQRLYRAFGYSGETRVTYPLANGLSIDFVPMRKVLAPNTLARDA
jgi:GNAT superfamily N-acetyltransferase